VISIICTRLQIRLSLGCAKDMPVQMCRGYALLSTILMCTYFALVLVDPNLQTLYIVSLHMLTSPLNISLISPCRKPGTIAISFVLTTILFLR
jgi:hypothetical protein